MSMPDSRARLMRRNLHLVLPVALFLLLRIPSFIEPHWYQDEAGYASTVSLTHIGYGLYVNAWNNKPPLLFGVYGLSQWLWGPGEAGLHVFSLISGLAALIAALWGMARLYSPRMALWSGLILAVVIGSPMFDGDLSLPESLLIGPVTVAVVWFLCSCAGPSAREARIRTLVLIGVLLACGALIQQTALADSASILIWCLVRRRWRTGLVIGGTVALLGLVVIVPYVITSGFHNVWFALVTSYVGYVNTALQARVFSLTFRTAVVLAIVGTAWLFRKAPDGRLELVRIWAMALMFTAIAPGYNYEHFLLPAAIPVVMLAAGIVSRHRDDLLLVVRRGRVLIAGVTAAALTAGVVVTFWSPSQGFGHTAWIAGYYQNALSYVTGSESEVAFDRYFGVDSYGEWQAEQWIRDHGLTGTTGMVWSNLAWPIVDVGLVPPTRSGPLYVTLALEHGTGHILSLMDATPPTVIIITPYHIENLEDIRTFISTHAYTKVLDENDMELYVRSDVGASLASSR